MLRLIIVSLIETNRIIIPTISIITLSLFLIFYHFVVLSSQFDIVENNLGRIFPGLATLLSIAIILNNFVLNDETKLMVKEPEALM
jgi:hypothetical protein